MDLVIELDGFTKAAGVPNLSHFICFRSNSSRSFREFDTQDANSRLAEQDHCLRQIKERSAYQVWMDASSGNPDSCLELGLRMYTGCGASQDKDGAIDWWLRISDPTNPNSIVSVSRSLKARALSCLSNAYLDESHLPNNILHPPSFYRAAQLANASASLGLVTPNTLAIAYMIDRRQADCHYDGGDAPFFESLQFLLKAGEARKEEMNKRRRKRDAKVSRSPHLYICSADRCGIEGTSRSGLLQCSGNCPLDVKPSYCSKECQRSDWKRHRVVCKGEAEAGADSKGTTPSPKKTDERITRTDGRELNIVLPVRGGKKVQVSSSTLSPSWLKEFRDHHVALEEAGVFGLGK